MAIRNEHLSNLGFRLSELESADTLEPLLEACNLEPLSFGDPAGAWAPARYLAASTRAGGIAACIGWNRLEEADHEGIVLHSLAVAPSSRHNGIGASLFASALGHVMDDDPVRDVYLIADAARAFFTRFGFNPIDRADVPETIESHPLFGLVDADATPLVRHYLPSRRGLDHCAFRLIHNTTSEEMLPVGSVFFFEQSGSMIEARYRGNPVRRGHLLARLEGSDFQFFWQQFVEDDELMRGKGRIQVSERSDGRRELREQLGDDPGEMLLREV
jgi:ribosomal protein S18 acetylase RimI-like enzyme